ncbi:hypothetical protein GCM10010987_38080 [Bradyrhizobium guangdongense]|nr:hypothetical protein GCM10010987_38080 [Bradyrhizobium guangdongense]
MLFEIVQKHYLGLETIQQAAESIRSSGTGLLRIAATPSLAMGVIPTIMKAFRQSSPGVSINLQTGGSLQIRDGLLNGIYDVGLTTSGAHFRTGEFEIEVCDESEALCAVCANSPLASKKEVAVSDFQEATLLTLNRGDDLSDLWRQTLAQHGVKPSSEIEVTYSAILCSLAAADLGIGVVSPYIKPLISDNVRFVRISPRISVKMFAIFPGHLVKSSLSQRFTRSLKETFLHNDPHVVKCGDCTE